MRSLAARRYRSAAQLYYKMRITALCVCFGEDTSAEKAVLKHARRGNLRLLVRALNRCSSSPNAVRDEKGRTALHLAAIGGHKECLKELLRRRADPNVQDKDGHTASHVLVLGGAPAKFPANDIITTRNPFLATYLITRGVYHLTVYYSHDRWVYRRCMQYLVHCGADLGVRSVERETARDIAVRMRKMALLEVIEEAYDLRVSNSGWHVEHGSSMLRPSQSYPPACPRWMHRQASSTSLVNKSPLTSNASLLYRGRGMNAYDYGFVFPCGSHTSPGAQAGVPTILPTDIIQSKRESCMAGDGSRWRHAQWEGLEVAVREHNTNSRWSSSELMVQEMENLSLLRHPNILLLMATCCGPLKHDLLLVVEPVLTYSLFQLLHQFEENFVTSRTRKVDVACGITKGLCYLHNVVGVAHCLISSHSVYVTRDFKPKLCNIYRCCQQSTKMSKSTAFVPYHHWMAPEFLHIHIASFAADVYSVGVVMWELWSGEEPWQGLYGQGLHQALVVEKQSLPLGEEHRDIAQLLHSAFSPRPEQRPSAKQVMSELNQEQVQNHTE